MGGSDLILYVESIGSGFGSGWKRFISVPLFGPANLMTVNKVSNKFLNSIVNEIVSKSLNLWVNANV